VCRAQVLSSLAPDVSGVLEPCCDVNAREETAMARYEEIKETKVNA
jgi:hypothetical protein